MLDDVDDRCACSLLPPTRTVTSIDCYWYCKKVQLESSDKEKKLQERMGNTLNEMGVYYMQVAKTLDYKKSEGETHTHTYNTDNNKNMDIYSRTSSAVIFAFCCKICVNISLKIFWFFFWELPTTIFL